MIVMLFGRGPTGLPEPTPLDFAALQPLASPNWCLALPSGTPGPAQLVTPTYPVPPQRLFETLLALAGTFPRVSQLSAWPERRQAQWVERSAVLNFPDIIVAEATAQPGGAGLLLYSRSLIGWSDLGVNRARVEKWMSSLEMAVR